MLSKTVLLCGAMALPACYALDFNLGDRRPNMFDFKSDENPPHESIIGGEEIKPNSRPYLVAVGDDYYGQYCGGSLISPRAVVTAAHCLFAGKKTWLPAQWVEFHRHDILDDTGVVRLYLNDLTQCEGDAVYHPGFDDKTLDNDVAILFLPEPITDITPVILNTDPNVPSEDAPLDVSGWGFTEFSLPFVANAVTVNYIDNEACTKKPYRFKDSNITENMLCAAAEGKDSCYGDSGGPLVLGKKSKRKGGPKTPVTQVGLVSWGGRKCADPKFAGVYTRISSVADFLSETVCERTGELCNMNSKSGKQYKGGKSGKGSIRRLDPKSGKGTKKSYADECVKVSTLAPTTETMTPTATPAPFTTHPTLAPTMPWPTWMPTVEAKESSGKSGKAARDNKAGKAKKKDITLGKKSAQKIDEIYDV